MKLRNIIFSKLFLLFILVAAAALGFAVWRQRVSSEAEGRYKTQAVEVGDVTKTVSANGTLNPVVVVQVGSQVSGTIDKLYADWNSKVRADQIVARLNQDLFNTAVDQAKANLLSAQANVGKGEVAVQDAKRTLDRNRELRKQELISQSDLDAAQAAYDTAVAQDKVNRAQAAQAQAGLNQANVNLQHTIIRSPVDGIVVSRNVDVGQTVASSFQAPTLFLIANDLTKMQIDSNFAEADIGNIKLGQPVRFTVDAFPERSFSAAVRQIRLNPIIQQNVVTYDVVVAVDNPEQILMPGMTAYVNIIVAERKNVLLVPNAALRFKPQEGPETAAPAKSKGDRETFGTVYVLKDNKLEGVKIKVGISDNRFTEVVGGDLKAGDRVVVSEVAGTEKQEPSSLRIRLL
jgi:HlyD family secretion protein